MHKLVRFIFTALVLISVTNPVHAINKNSPGYLLTGNAVYDDKRYALLNPASLFDTDNTPSVFRLGMVWDERNGDEMRFIISFPISEQVRLDDLKKGAKTFEIKIDGVPEKLQRVKNSIVRKQQEGVFSKSYEAEIRYTGSRKVVEKMLSAKNVSYSIQVMMKKFQANLRVTDKKQLYFQDKEYTAINGMQRFKEAVWGK